MNAGGSCSQFGWEPSLFRRQWLRLLQTATVIILLVGPASALHAAPDPSSSRPTAHVYLLRGVLNVFSLGMDQIAAKLEQRGVQSTVTNYLFWSSLADEIAADYKRGKVRTVILVGHS